MKIHCTVLFLHTMLLSVSEYLENTGLERRRRRKWLRPYETESTNMFKPRYVTCQSE